MNINEVIKKFEKTTGSRVLYVTKSGSKLYGTDNPNSDTDYKGIFLPSKQSLILNNSSSSFSSNSNNTMEKNSNEDIDFTLHSLHDFFNHIQKSETGAVDLLFSMFREDTIVYEDKIFTSMIKDNYSSFLNTHMSSFIGYALGMAKKYGIKGARYAELEEFINSFFSHFDPKSQDKLKIRMDAIKDFVDTNNFRYIKIQKAKAPRGYKDEFQDYINVLGKLFSEDITFEYLHERVQQLYIGFGNRTKTISKTENKVDYKALSHAYRIASEVKELLETEFIQFPLKERDYVKEIKSGLHDQDKIVDEIQDILDSIDTLILYSKINDKSDRKLMDKIILSFYEN